MTRNIPIVAAVICAALCLATSPALYGETSDFFTKFQMQDAPDWSGWYGGFNVGGSWNHFDAGKQPTDVNLTDQFYDLGTTFGNVEVLATFHTPGHDDTQGVTVGGVQTGFNLQFGHFLIGAEGMFIGNGSHTSTNYHEFQINHLFDGGMSPEARVGGVTAETDFYSRRTFEAIWNGFVGGKLGFALNRLLFYGAGGVAFSDIHIHTMETADTSFFQGDCDGSCPDRLNQPQSGFIGEVISRKKGGEGELLTGWYGGVGTDFALTNIVSIGLEYRHVDWGDKTGHFKVGPDNGPVFPSDQNVGLDGDQVLLKFNIMLSHFNPFH